MPHATANDVAVIVVNYNAGDYLIACLAALNALPQLPGEIIVVDNDSDDGSIEHAREQFASVKFIDSGSNAGFATANNMGIATTNKPWVALVNPDAYVAENWLEALLNAINSNPDVQFFSSELVSAKDHKVIDGQGDCYHVSGLVWRRKHGLPVDMPESKLPLFAPCAASAVYSHEALRDVGCFDEDYFCYNEDIDLGFRLRLAGYRCLHVRESIAYHEGSAITERESDFSIFYGHRNLVWTYFKNMPLKSLWFYLPQHLLMNIVSLVYYTAKGRPGVIFRAKWAAIRGLPTVLRKRSEMPPRVDVTKAMAKGWLRPYFFRGD